MGATAHLVEQDGARGEALHGVDAVPEGEVALEGQAVEEQVEGGDSHLKAGGEGGSLKGGGVGGGAAWVA